MYQPAFQSEGEKKVKVSSMVMVDGFVSVMLSFMFYQGGVSRAERAQIFDQSHIRVYP